MVWVERFEFLVEADGKPAQWMQLLGSGGRLGDGLLHNVQPGDSERIPVLAAALVVQGRRLARRGYIREMGRCPWNHLDAAQIKACRAVGFSDPEHARLRGDERPPYEVVWTGDR